MKVNALAAIAKPKGLSSSDVVVKCRGALSHALGERQKCGHMGTLDPMAEGVLVLGFGKAARLFDLMQNKTKEYRATVEFGYITDTLDAEGAVTDRTDLLPSKDDLIAAVGGFVGKIEQIPPKYSALNIEGRRAYDLARRGAHFVVPTREVEIFSIDPTHYSIGENGVKEMTFDVVCGSGTYIRSLCRDIALACGSLGCMTALTRTRSGNFDLNGCVPLADFLADTTAHLVDVAATLEKMMPRIDVDDDTARKLLNGRTAELTADGDVAVFCGKLLGIAQKNGDGYKLDIRLCD